MPERTVSVIVPCRNERRYLPAFLDSLSRQDLPPGVRLEVLIADGMSDDGTTEMLRDHASRHANVAVLENPGRIVSTGLNRAIARASGETIVRMDVHAEYASDYIAQCLAVLDETGADNVGGPARTRAHGYWQRAISAAYHSPFSCGGARFHNTSYEGPVDTVTFGCWPRKVLEEIGSFDEQLVRNQDDELNLRIVRLGGRIWQSPRIRSWYRTRSRLVDLFRQYFQYGYWKVRVIGKHRLPASVRHLVPAGFVGSLLLLAAASPFSAAARWLLAAACCLYALALLAASLDAARRSRCWDLLPALPLVFATYHLAYGTGFLAALVNPRVRRQQSPGRSAGAC